MPADDPDHLKRLGVGKVSNDESIGPPEAIPGILDIFSLMSDAWRGGEAFQGGTNVLKHDIGGFETLSSDVMPDFAEILLSFEG